jgi:hypothetical protein
VAQTITKENNITGIQKKKNKKEKKVKMMLTACLLKIVQAIEMLDQNLLVRLYCT